MRKFIKIAVVLMALGLLATACSKVRTTNLIGTYRSGSSTMTVDANGQVDFNIASDVATDNVLSTLNQNIVPSNAEYGEIMLIPWDLTSEKQSYDFTYQGRISQYQSGGSGPGSYTYTPVTISFNFTKDNETINCSVNVSVEGNDFTSGSVTFSK